jgi:RhtB (resistance to homoserine/threonine) family protein
MAISPGPDFFMVTKNSIIHNKKAGVYSALGVSIAIWLHIAYSIAGLTLIISKSILLFSVIKYIGAAYLIYIGFNTIFSKANLAVELNDTQNKKSLSKLGAFKNGFITNALNPKTTIFFLSIFTQIIDINTSIALQLLYGVIISVVHFLWFYIVAIFFSHSLFLSKFQKHQKRIENIVGAALIAFGLKIAFTSVD